MMITSDLPRVTQMSAPASLPASPHTPNSLSDPSKGVPRTFEKLIRPNIALAPYTTFRVGGPAEWYCEPYTIDDLKVCLTWSAEQNLLTTFLGAGSNLLISDGGVSGLVVNTRKLRGIQCLEDGRVWAASGEPIAKLARLVAKWGWSGLEWAIGIPGSVGGSVVMNAGAHGSSVGDRLVMTTALDENYQCQCLMPGDLQLGYRNSILQQRNWLVTGACFQLEPGHDPEAVWERTEQNWLSRQRSQPYNLPSCGSVFRNPPSHAAGWLIEQTGLKGHQVGGAQVAQRHANFILNFNHATAKDIHTLIQLVQERVFHRWSLQLEPEVRMLGDFEADPA